MVNSVPFKKFKAELGVNIPDVLLPNENINLSKWSVVACDQYTSQPEYWDEVKKIVNENSSTLNLIFPEVYLENESENEKNFRIQKINSEMKSYIQKNILVYNTSCMIYLDRKTSHAKSRKGLILSVDLEKYDYNKGSQTLIRATEGTVLDRLPPRIKVREKAILELPHIMLLIDDIDKTVIEPLSERIDELEKIYDFDLMMNGGHIKGYKIDNEEILLNILSSLEKLSNPGTFYTKYSVDEDKGVLLFAVGDGNHSLATAKACWENLKATLSKEELTNHPSRFALVEVVNVHDEGLEFEPIHRVVFNVNSKNLLESMVEYFYKNDSKSYYKFFESEEDMNKEVDLLKNNQYSHIIPFVAKESFGIVVVNSPKFNLAVGTLQSFLDQYIKENPLVKIDYIHGEDVVNSLGSKENNMGFYLPSMDKTDLFKTVILDGALPRKTFSMGEAEEKRFYLECRKIVED